MTQDGMAESNPSQLLANALRMAVVDENMDELRKYIGKGADVNGVDAAGKGVCTGTGNVRVRTRVSRGTRMIVFPLNSSWEEPTSCYPRPIALCSMEIQQENRNSNGLNAH